MICLQKKAFFITLVSTIVYRHTQEGIWLTLAITSVAAACFVLIFVIIQRYNRSRIMKLAKLEKR